MLDARIPGKHENVSREIVDIEAVRYLRAHGVREIGRGIVIRDIAEESDSDFLRSKHAATPQRGRGQNDCSKVTGHRDNEQQKLHTVQLRIGDPRFHVFGDPRAYENG